MATPRLDREAVVRAAADIADREGFHSLTLARLATVVDRHVSSLYNHVDGLEGLRREVAAMGARELGDAVTTAAVGRAGGEAIDAIAHAYRDYMRAHPGRYYAVILTPLEDPDPGARTVQTIHAVLRSFGLSDDAVIHAHRVLTAAIRGFGIIEQSRGFAPHPDPDLTFQQLIDLFVANLTAGSWPNDRGVS
jgi:AcrR family transcriptional regulator